MSCFLSWCSLHSQGLRPLTAQLLRRSNLKSTLGVLLRSSPQSTVIFPNHDWTRDCSFRSSRTPTSKSYLRLFREHFDLAQNRRLHPSFDLVTGSVWSDFRSWVLFWERGGRPFVGAPSFQWISSRNFRLWIHLYRYSLNHRLQTQWFCFPYTNNNFNF